MKNTNDVDPFAANLKGDHSPALVICDAQSWADVVAASASERKGLQGFAIGNDCVGITIGHQRRDDSCDVGIQLLKLLQRLRREDDRIDRTLNQAFEVVEP